MKKNKISFSWCAKISNLVILKIVFSIFLFVKRAYHMGSVTDVYLWSVYHSMMLFGQIIHMLPRSFLMSKER